MCECITFFSFLFPLCIFVWCLIYAGEPKLEQHYMFWQKSFHKVSCLKCSLCFASIFNTPNVKPNKYLVQTHSKQRSHCISTQILFFFCSTSRHSCLWFIFFLLCFFFLNSAVGNILWRRFLS